MPNYKVLTLALTQNCNIHCDYCYVKKRNTSLKLATGKKAINIFLRSSVSNPLIVFTGGEPLLELPLILKLIKYAKAVSKEKKVNFGIPTNGVLLNEKKIDLLQKEGVNLMVSVDGLSHKLNCHRRLTRTKDSLIVLNKNIELFKRKGLGVRMTVHPDNAGEFYRGIVEFLKLGFDKIDIQPAIGLKWSEKEVRTFRANFKKLLGIYYHINYKLKVLTIKCIDDLLIKCSEYDKGISKNLCLMGAGELAVSTTGGIYPCSLFLTLGIEKKEFLIGSVNLGLKKSGCEVLLQKYYSKDRCLNCSLLERCNKLCLHCMILQPGEKEAIANSNCALERAIQEEVAKFYNYLKRKKHHLIDFSH